jgi:hypothetical protein
MHRPMFSISTDPFDRIPAGASPRSNLPHHTRARRAALLVIACLALTPRLPADPQDVSDEATHTEHQPEHQPGDSPSGRDRLVFGDVARLPLGRIVSWALLTRSGKIEEIGVTVPLEIILNQTETGDGPLGAIASLKFPRVVRDSTYFDHVEIHWNPHGHASPPTDPDRYAAPHFDLHYFTVPEAIVWAIPAEMVPGPDVQADRLPANWLQPGPSEPEMGRHSLPTSIANGPFVAEMLAGYLPSGSTMHFIEPMITREFLAQAQDFALPVPRPEKFGRTMLYPEKFAAEYDAKLKAYHFVFRQFVIVE